ncbi:hypothetical protein [Acidovorax sacchari]|uniref:hypothetical protein n=1 Tax=Acidovorax sacchari TaxID=3230736 RepID=UPI0039E2D63B
MLMPGPRMRLSPKISMDMLDDGARQAALAEWLGGIASALAGEENERIRDHVPDAVSACITT